jgi:hypothetical protein
VKCDHNKMVVEVVKEPGSQVYLENLKDFHGTSRINYACIELEFIFFFLCARRLVVQSGGGGRPPALHARPQRPVQVRHHQSAQPGQREFYKKKLKVRREMKNFFAGLLDILQTSGGRVRGRPQDALYGHL